VVRIKYIFYLAALILICSVQLVIVPFLSIGSVHPDILLIFVVYISLKEGQIKGTVAGFLSGLIFDLVSGGVMGSGMFSKTLAAFIAGYFYKDSEQESHLNNITFSAIILLAGTIDSFFHTIFGVGGIKIGVFFLLFEYGFFPALFSAAISLPLVLIKQKRDSL